MKPAAKPKQEWSPRLWHGADLFAWLRLLIRNRVAVQPPYWHIAAVATAASVMNSTLGFLSDAAYGGRIDRTPIREAPLFIIGHWRTGTTLLHELLILDPRHTFPTTYQCLCPHHWLLTERIFPHLFWFLMPAHRPMDNMETGWDRPQEDEFALAVLGQPSPYLTIAFPNHPPQDQEALDLERLPPRARAAWKQAFLRFLRALTLKDPRRLVLKSPTHSCRINTLLELFPDARFVHIVRDPYVVFPSTVNLWKSLYRNHGLQTPTFAGLEEHVFETFNHLYSRLEEGKRLVAPDRFHEVRYEDLIRDPEAQMRLLYDRLGLGGFDAALPRIQKYLGDHAGYQTNRYPSLTPELRAEITRQWGGVIQRYGYTTDDGQKG
ncbi:MAG TPA: sulfotransferase [Gemmataceae bacterium]|nr:sulfotransferase [Gemmataceae bacterium]